MVFMPIEVRVLVKPLVFLTGLLPAAWLTWALLNDALGANPFEELTRQSGLWTLRFLLLTLAMTPLRRLLGRPWPLRYRRMLGLFTFFYASAHLLTYLWFDQFFDWQEIFTDIAKRPFITVGMLAWLLLLPLALTSTKGMMKRLGRHWKRLHQLVYAIGLLAVLHFLWLVKADLREPLIYMAILLSLLGVRLYLRPRRKSLLPGRKPAPDCPS